MEKNKGGKGIQKEEQAGIEKIAILNIRVTLHERPVVIMRSESLSGTRSQRSLEAMVRTPWLLPSVTGKPCQLKGYECWELIDISEGSPASCRWGIDCRVSGHSVETSSEAVAHRDDGGPGCWRW